MALNKRCKIVLTNRAQRDLGFIDSSVAKNIAKKLFYFESLENPMAFAKSLSVPFVGKYRFRIGEYRAIFEAKSDKMVTTITIINIVHRKDVYR